MTDDDELEGLEGLEGGDDDGWAVVVATDDEAAAQAVHDRLRLGGLEAYIRDLDPDERGPDDLAIQVIVPAEEAVAAALELDMERQIRAVRADPGRLDRVRELGLEVDDLEIAELSATGGPVYELDALGDAEDITVLLDALQSARVRFTLDREANLVVHHNDEARVDEIMDRLFGPEGSDPGPSDTAAPRAGADDPSEGDVAGSGIDADPIEVTVTRRGPSASVADLDGRPAVDDMTPDVVAQPARSPLWIYVLAAIVLVVIFIVLVV